MKTQFAKLALTAALGLALAFTSCKRTFTDTRDGKIYKSVKIGSGGKKQVWMAENLNYNASGSKCYDNNEANCDKYGRLYNWETAIKACPEDWHLPSYMEWNLLLSNVDNTDYTIDPYKSETAGKFLKAKSGWNDNGNGNDKYGFSALPGGWLWEEGYNSGDDGRFGIWWSATEAGAEGYGNYAYSRNMSNIDDGVDHSYRRKDSYISVRCLQGSLTTITRLTQNATAKTETITRTLQDGKWMEKRDTMKLD